MGEPSKRKNTNHPRKNQTRNKRCSGNGFKKWLKTVECGRYVGSSCPGAQMWRPGEAKVSTEDEKVFYLYPSPQTYTSRTFYIYRERRDVNRKKCCSVDSSNSCSVESILNYEFQSFFLIFRLVFLSCIARIFAVGDSRSKEGPGHSIP